MTLLRTALGFSVLLLACMACSPAPEPDTGETVGSATDQTVAPAPEASTPSALPAGAGSEGEVLGFLLAVNAHEIAAAQQAQGKQVDGALREYVDMLHTQHSRNLAETRALSDSSGVATIDTPDVDALKARSQSELQRLSALEGDAYEVAFVDAMIKDHSEALATIDNRLMAAATTAAIREHLIATRAAIEKHLEAVQALKT